jgi:hypothetical protein
LDNFLKYNRQTRHDDEGREREREKMKKRVEMKEIKE